MSTNKTMRAAIYCRTNIPDRTGAEQQKTIAMKIAKEQELEIFDIYTDIGYSGNDFERPALRKMMIDIEDGKIDCVIIESFSRLGRDMVATMQIANRIREGGIFLVIADTIPNQPQEEISLC